ncbi:myosin light chain kinase family member 4 [Gymnogyps californianus]|uniref:myosin light chain kinase family member 4 n=1 Tax=Gymnogyps californianus TaxID=33616 RepID=UPI0021C614E9|nr:myosin light chain kinase family member 4 [Gymnogyps californianus]
MEAAGRRLETSPVFSDSFGVCCITPWCGVDQRICRIMARSQEGGEIRSYKCSLVYESKVERKTDSKLTGHSMKLLKINRLEEINARYNSNRLEKTAFFQSMEKMERTRSFQEEKFSEFDPGTEDEKLDLHSEVVKKLCDSAALQNQKFEFKRESKRKTSLAYDSPTPPAPFDHRIVSAKRVGISSYYNVSENEILGGGRFGQVHKCEEKATGLKLAAKIIKAKDPKQKDEVKNEINVMNQLNHVNLIQLYDAFESKNDIVLVMEYVEGGELFDRIIDENCNLTEMDTILFIKQICEGIQYMHQMYILHLDLKPENILCVNRTANQIKIIDFGLARRYKPREKLRVNFGTPEFLAPEVVNYEFVSFPTDMWSVGVIAYMLLSGLSPFLGDDDNETLNNILSCSWDFEDEEFQDVSDQAKDFISKLLIKEKCWRISATAALKHPWLSDHKLHCRLQVPKFKYPCALKRLKVTVCPKHPRLNNLSERAAKQKKSCCVVTAAKRFENISSLGALPPCCDRDFY